MQLNDLPNDNQPNTNPSSENLYGKENPTNLTSPKKISDAYFDAKKGLEVDHQKTEILPTSEIVGNQNKPEKISEQETQHHFESMQEHEIGDPLHISPQANLTSENTKSLNKRLSEDSTKKNSSEESKKPNPLTQKENMKSEIRKKKNQQLTTPK